MAKVNGDDVPFASDAVAETIPCVLLAVMRGEVAIPFPSVCDVGVPLNVPDGPEAGRAKVTVAPDTGLPNASSTRALNGAGNCSPVETICPPPLKAKILEPLPAEIWN